MAPNVTNRPLSLDNLEPLDIWKIWNNFKNDPNRSSFIPFDPTQDAYASTKKTKEYLEKTRDFIRNLPKSASLEGRIIGYITSLNKELDLVSIKSLPLTLIARLRKEEDFLSVLSRLDPDILPAQKKLENITTYIEQRKEKLFEIEHLNLQETYITTFPKELYPYLRNVKSVNLSNNNLGGTPLQFFVELFQLPNITHLDLSSNDFSLEDWTLIATLLPLLKKIKCINLKDSDFKECPSLLFEALVKIYVKNLKDRPAPAIGRPPGLHVCSGMHKRRLLIGEGNFSFAWALIHKHDRKFGHSLGQSLAGSIIATDLNTEIYCFDCSLSTLFADMNFSMMGCDQMSLQNHCTECLITSHRIDKIREKGAIVSLGIDGKKLHEIEEFRGIERIHWNCPHDRSDFRNQTLPPIIADFFKSCAKVQDSGSRVHITLVQPIEHFDFYQGYIYDIVKAASLAGYVLLKKRLFNEDRYPGYEHVITGTNRPAPVTRKGMREFVFKKTDQETFAEASKFVLKQYGETSLTPLSGEHLIGKLAQQLIDHEVPRKCCEILTKEFQGQYRNYFLCSSDEDSSDCDE